MHSLPGIDVSVGDSCSGCGACMQGVCFADSIKINNNRAHIDDSCRGCGRCVTICPEEAISLTLPQKDPAPKLIKLLETLVDVE